MKVIIILIDYKIVILLSVNLFCELWLVFDLCNIRNINWVLKKNNVSYVSLRIF